MSKHTGFLPEFQPSSRLPAYFDPWESLISELSQLIETKEIYTRVETLPKLEVSDNTLPRKEDWWRAYVVTTFISQGYVWADEEAVRDIVPECIAVPWWETAKKLDMPAVINYSNTCLFNWGLWNPSKHLDETNLHSLTTFSGLDDEKWFYITFVLVEMRAAAGVSAMVEAFSAVANDNKIRLMELLSTIKDSLLTMTNEMKKIHERCKPDKFWNGFRRFQRGTKGYTEYFPNGLIYKGVDQQPKLYCGASAGQSSTIPTFDIFLGVPQMGFLQEQRMYMPPPHRQFLKDLEEEAECHPVRKFVAESKDYELIAAFNAIVDTLVDFRQQHFNIVFRYIIAFMPGAANDARGTGGTHVKHFLKGIQQNTRNTKIAL